VNRFALNFWSSRYSFKSARGLAQSKTLTRWNWLAKFAKRLGLRQPSGALAVAITCLVLNSRAATNDFFPDGVVLSHAGQFPEAAAAFENSAKQQPSSGALVNLGLAEWQRGHAGPAILAWERAQWIDPFDVSAQANLKFARPVAQVDEPELKWFEAASTWLPPDAWVWLAGGSLWLAVGALLLPGIFRRRKAGWHQFLTALGLCVFIFSLMANIGVVSRTQIGFVLKKNAPLLLTPTREGEIISTLTAGEPARKLRTRGNYFFIRTVNGTGWVERQQFGLINPK
jgi:tetratricopeptide (TPR) repeat protein